MTGPVRVSKASPALLRLRCNGCGNEATTPRISIFHAKKAVLVTTDRCPACAEDGAEAEEVQQFDADGREIPVEEWHHDAT